MQVHDRTEVATRRIDGSVEKFLFRRRGTAGVRTVCIDERERLGLQTSKRGVRRTDDPAVIDTHADVSGRAG